jgi:uncharacterized protein (TIGR00288 family)
MENDSPERQGGTRPDVDEAHQAALLIDFDNVTMGIRSNLGQELRNLLNSDVIRGKVAVQRAYADWRRYPQYIVPLSEASIDLIFAPAYGSSKKNATDIRLAIDALELVFIRPEIRTYILMSGDSDFSSLVLKLKEYGKYVIGVGIQESSSDLLVQNCDEYYGYSSLSGLSKSGEQPLESHDPWVLVGKAIARMVERGDTMRSDRLKQVMIEIDPSFNEKEQGYTKFNRFVVEAASKGLLSIQKMENGQYGVAPDDKTAKGAKGAKPAKPAKREPKAESRRDQSHRGRERERDRPERQRRDEGKVQTSRARPKLTMKSALQLLDKALDALLEGDTPSVRDSDVKRRILELDPGFDEAELGYSKFSKFLQAAEEADAIQLTRGPNGNYHVGRTKHSGRRKPRQPAAATAVEAGQKATKVQRLTRFLFGTAPKEGPEAKAPPAEKKPEPRRQTESPRQREARGERRGGREQKKAPAEGQRGRRAARPADRGAKADPPTPRDAKPRRGEPRAASGRKAGERRPRDEARGPRREERRPREAEIGREKREREEKERAAAVAQPTPPDIEPRESTAKTAAEIREPAPKADEVVAKEASAPGRKQPEAEKSPGAAPAPLPGAPRGTIRGRWGTRGRYRPAEAPPPVFEGQKKPGSRAGSPKEAPAPGRAVAEDRTAGPETRSIVSRLTGYPGVGRKTAESLVEAFGAETLKILDEQPERVREVLPDHRAERVLEARREELEAGGR